MNTIHQPIHRLLWCTILFALLVFSIAEVEGQPPSKRPLRLPSPVAPGGPRADAISPADIYYGTGEIRLTGADLDFHSATRTYSTEFSGGQSECIGYTWRLNGLPHVINCNKQVIVSFGFQHAYWFNVSGDSYKAQFGAKQTMTHDATNHLFQFMEPDATVYEFFDFNGKHPGQFHRSVTPGGQTVEVLEWTSSGRIKKVHYKVSKEAVAWKLWEYSYVSSGKNKDWLESVVYHTRDKPSMEWTNPATLFRRATYTYYVTGADEKNGLSGDLKTVVRQSWDGNAWAGNDTHYYRYYVDAPRAHLLKMVLSPSGFANAKAVYPDPTSPKVSDHDLLRFSKQFYDYNADGRVVRTSAAGGPEVRFSYTDQKNKKKAYSSSQPDQRERKRDGPGE